MIEFSKSFKKPQGKLLNLVVRVSNDCIIKDLVVSGDFFAYPPENIDELQSRIKGFNVCSEEILKQVIKVLSNTALAGLELSDFLSTLREVLNEGCRRCREGVSK